MWDSLKRGPLKHNFAGAIVLQIALLVSGVLSARLLGPTNRGYLALLGTFASTIGQLGAVGISLSATYHLASKKVHGHEILGLLRRPAATQLVGLTALYALVVAGYTYLADAPIQTAALISVAQIPALLAADYGIALALGARNHALASWMRAVAPILYAVFVTLLFLADIDSLTALEIAVVVSGSIAGAVIIFKGVRASRNVTADESMVASLGKPAARRELLDFGWRGYFGYLAPTESFRLDQLLVGLMLSPTALGIYVVGAAFSNFPRIVALNIGLSSTAEVAHQTEPAERRRIARHTLALTAGLLTAVSIATAPLLLFMIPWLFGNDFEGAVAVGEVLLVAAWFMCMKRVAVDLLRGAGELRAGTRAEAINLVLFFALSIPLGLSQGEVAVAASLAAAGACGCGYLFIKMRQMAFI